ncbi:hypothetical protein PPYR_09273 [Photinus pyralis]|uniref:PHD-type domain-containing protein n=1 Tax=Photinus pyralis TaxID=7054 RepID=A0A5N4ALR8_PHOPY|nr:protein AF-10 isoform X1 [Photinus pyralis]KAB0798280.1 hypothetical protein PPYR_09273 [Photinus pyralis]
MKEMVGGCCVCSDDRGWPENPLVYCDGQSCTVAVHQACYGIVTVPTGPWYCRKCESQERTARVKCELCPSKYGALKRTDNSGWAHVVCALYIPEVRFGNVTTMEPIQLQLIPSERFNKVCYICEEQGKASSAGVGACMQCNKAGCKQQFHVTCAQTLGLLCEEAGNYLDNVKYCGYCQHHYSKLKKGGNVKTIPPYKPISNENHLSDSNSEKDSETNLSVSTKSSSSQPAATGKRKSSSANKTSSSNSKSSANSKTVVSHQKTVHNNNSKIERDKPKVTSAVKSAKSGDDSSVASSAVDSVVEIKTDRIATPVIKDAKIEIELEPKTEHKDSKINKKRKSNSRTPTPNTVPSESVIPAANLSVLIPELSASVLSGITGGTVIAIEKRESSVESVDKKKVKLDHSQPALIPSVAIPIAVSPVVKSNPSPPQLSVPVDQASVLTTVISPTSTGNILPSINSLVVSVPLLNTNLSPHPNIINNPTSVVTTPITYPSLPQEQSIAESIHKHINDSPIMTGDSNQSASVITSEMSGDGLKITYEQQQGAVPIDLESNSNLEEPLPTKRTRSMSGEKAERGGRRKKPGTNVASTPSMNATKRSSRSQNTTSPPNSSSIIPPNQIKESPPSSPNSESQGAMTRANRNKTRQKAQGVLQSTAASAPGNVKETKDTLKVFQNGVSAPHMLGNQLNPNSNMAQKMSDHLSSELEAHSIFNVNEPSPLIGPQLHHRVLANARSNSTGGSSTASGGSGFSMLGGGGGSIPQTLDQLLERQWEQGSQFLMEQAQHFDIASLLSCLHQLRAENLRLEEHVSSLLQRRDHLLAVNARLAIPLTGQPATSQSSHPHTVNNIHPSVLASHGEASRSRHNSTGSYPSHPQQVTVQHAPMAVENGLPPETTQIYPHHRSPASTQSQSTSSVRHSPAGSTGYPSSGIMRQSGDSGRTAPRPQPYPLYQGPGPSTAQSQVVIRRDPELQTQPSSKPS